MAQPTEFGGVTGSRIGSSSVPAQGSPEPVREGQVLSGVVVVSDPQAPASSAVARKGVDISGTFVAVKDLPPGIKVGERVDVAVTRTSPEFSLQYLQSTTSATAGATPPDAQAGLMQLLEAVDLSEKGLGDLRQMILNVRPRVSHSEAVTLPKITRDEVLREFLVKSGIPADADLAKRELVIESLKSFNAGAMRVPVADALFQQQQIVRSAPLPVHVERLERLVKDIELLISQPKGTVDSKREAEMKGPVRPQVDRTELVKRVMTVRETFVREPHPASRIIIQELDSLAREIRTGPSVIEPSRQSLQGAIERVLKVLPKGESLRTEPVRQEKGAAGAAATEDLRRTLETLRQKPPSGDTVPTRQTNPDTAPVVSSRDETRELQRRISVVRERLIGSQVPPDRALAEALDTVSRELESQSVSRPREAMQLQAALGRAVQALTKEVDSQSRTSSPVLRLEREQLRDSLVVELEKIQKRSTDTTQQIPKPVVPDAKVISSDQRIFSGVSTGEPVRDLLVSLSGVNPGREQPELEIFRRQLREVIDAQIEVLRDLDIRVRTVLGGNDRDNPVESLLRTLSQSAELLEGSDAPVERQLQQLIKTLVLDLEQALKAPKPLLAVREVLEAALQSIQKEFGLPDIRARIQLELAGETPAPHLPQEVRVTLRLLEVQIRTLLEAPDLEEQMTRYLAATTSAEREHAPLMKEMRDLVVTLEKLSVPEDPGYLNLAPAARQTVKNALATLQQILQAPAGTETRDPKVMTQELRRVLSELDPILSEISLTSGPPEKEIASFAPGREPRPPIRSENDRARRLIEGMVRTITETLEGLEIQHEQGQQQEVVVPHRGTTDPAGNLLRSVNLLSGQVSDTAVLVQRIKLDLQTLQQTLPAAGNKAERELFDLTLEMLHHVDQTGEGRESVSGSSKESLKQLSKVVRENYIPPRDLSPQTPLARMDLASLRSLDSMLSAQETLQRLTPVMQALGEPALLLFPCIVQGFLTHAEIRFSRPPAGEGDVRKEASTPGANRDQFERINLVLPLPTIGEISVDIAHRKGEILMNLGFESSVVGEFVREQLPLLGRALQRRGFQKIDINIAEFTRRPGAAAGASLRDGEIRVA